MKYSEVFNLATLNCTHSFVIQCRALPKLAITSGLKTMSSCGKNKDDSYFLCKQFSEQMLLSFMYWSKKHLNDIMSSLKQS